MVDAARFAGAKQDPRLILRTCSRPPHHVPPGPDRCALPATQPPAARMEVGNYSFAAVLIQCVSLWDVCMWMWMVPGWMGSSVETHIDAACTPTTTLIVHAPRRDRSRRPAQPGPSIGGRFAGVVAPALSLFEDRRMMPPCAVMIGVLIR